MRLTLEEVALNNSNRKEFSHFKDFLDQEQKELIEYKTIEDELGIELVTLFKAIRDGIYVEGKKKPKFRSLWFDNIDSGITDEDVGLYWFDIDDKRFYFKDYGKTWALTREELL